MTVEVGIRNISLNVTNDHSSLGLVDDEQDASISKFMGSIDQEPVAD